MEKKNKLKGKKATSLKKAKTLSSFEKRQRFIQRRQLANRRFRSIAIESEELAKQCILHL